MAASVRTLVVSWNDAADRNESVASEALVMPSSSGWPTGGFLPSAIRAFASFSNSKRLTWRPGRKSESPAIENGHLAQHLARDDLDVLVVDVYALGHVHALDLGNDVAKRRVRVGQAQQVVRVHPNPW